MTGNTKPEERIREAIVELHEDDYSKHEIAEALIAEKHRVLYGGLGV